MAAQKAGDDAKFKAKAAETVKYFDEAGGELDELVAEADLIKRGLWDDYFTTYDKKFARWTKMVRQYFPYRQ